MSGYASVYDQVVVAIGKNALCQSLADRLLQAGLLMATVVDPKAVVSPRAQLDAGIAVMAGAIVGTTAVLGQGVIRNCGAVVDHYSCV